MTIDVFLKIFYLQTFLSAFVAFVSFYKFKKRSISTRLIGLLFLCSFLSNTIAYVFVSYLKRNGNIVGGIYELILVMIAALIYHINTSKRYGKWFVITAALLVIFGLTNLLFFQKDSGASLNKIAISIVINAYCLFYFYRIIIELPSRQVHTLPMFWFTSALLFFHSTAFFLFFFYDYLIVVLKDDMIIYWSFHNIVSILQHGLVLIGLRYDIKYLKKMPLFDEER